MAPTPPPTRISTMALRTVLSNRYALISWYPLCAKLRIFSGWRWTMSKKTISTTMKERPNRAKPKTPASSPASDAARRRPVKRCVRKPAPIKVTKVRPKMTGAKRRSIRDSKAPGSGITLPNGARAKKNAPNGRPNRQPCFRMSVCSSLGLIREKVLVVNWFPYRIKRIVSNGRLINPRNKIIAQLLSINPLLRVYACHRTRPRFLLLLYIRVLLLTDVVEIKPTDVHLIYCPVAPTDKSGRVRILLVGARIVVIRRHVQDGVLGKRRRVLVRIRDLPGPHEVRYIC